jgi:hypothetical protein
LTFELSASFFRDFKSESRANDPMKLCAGEINLPMPEINEWTFAAEVCKTIQGILADNPGLPFTEAKVKQGAGTFLLRNSYTLLGRLRVS